MPAHAASTARRVADHDLHVEFGTDRRSDHLVLLDDDDVVALRPETLGEVPADFSRSDDDMHIPACPIGPNRSRAAIDAVAAVRRVRR
jgi:hypothetical protein